MYDFFHNKTLHSFVIALFIIQSAFSQSGQLDASWANNGFNALPFVSQQVYIYDIGLQSDGKVILAGGRKNGANFDMYVMRLLADGSVDDTFGDNNGYLLIDFGYGSDVAYSLIIDEEDRIVLGGYAVSVSATNTFAMVRLTPEGALDTNFSVDGKFNTSIGNINDIAFDLYRQPDGKFLLAGSSYSNNSNGYNFSILRMLSDGSGLDTGFGNNGLLSLDNGATDETCFAIGMQSDGSIVIAGESTIDNVRQFTTIRLDNEGDPDFNFGVNSAVLTPFGQSASVKDVYISADDKIIVAGPGRDNSALEAVCMARYLSDGTLDDTFGIGGTVITQTGSNINEYSLATSIRMDPSGKLLVCGSEFKNGILTSLLLRYLQDGTLDLGFGAGGKAILNGSDYGENCIAQSCIITPDDGIIITGYGGNIGSFQQRSFKFQGCSSSIISTQASACGSYTWPADGETYNTSGTYIYSIDTGPGCDTIYELQLQVTVPPILLVNLINSTLTAAQGNATYQWLDCNAGMTAISGATNQSYTPATSGSYAVAINKNGCIDTTACYQITISSLEEIFSFTLEIYPNPASEEITLKSDKPLGKAEILDLTGRTVFISENLHSELATLPITSLARGTYFVRVSTTHGEAFIKHIILN